MSNIQYFKYGSTIDKFLVAVDENEKASIYFKQDDGQWKGRAYEVPVADIYFKEGAYSPLAIEDVPKAVLDQTEPPPTKPKGTKKSEVTPEVEESTV